MKNLSAETWSLALCIAILPPIWAVLAPYLSVDVGAVALICAGFVCHQWQQADGCPQDNHWILAGESLEVAGSECYAKFLLERRCHHLHDVVFAGRSGGHHSGYGFRDDTLSVMALRLGNHPYGAVTP